MADPGTTQVEYSHAVQVKEVLQVPFPVGLNLSWDSYWRSVYNRSALILDRQAAIMLERGNLVYDEVKYYVEVQRNGLVRELRKPLSPMGRMYSEILKPSDKLPTLEGLLKKKGSIEAVLRSIGKTRASVNTFALVSRIVGPITIAIEITMTVVVINLAPPDKKQREAAKQGGGLIGGAAGGAAGMWAGCATLAALVSPSLVVPVVGEITEGTACLVGGILGGMGIGSLGRWLGEKAGEKAWDGPAEWEWR